MHINTTIDKPYLQLGHLAFLPIARLRGDRRLPMGARADRRGTGPGILQAQIDAARCAFFGRALGRDHRGYLNLIGSICPRGGKASAADHRRTGERQCTRPSYWAANWAATPPPSTPPGRAPGDSITASGANAVLWSPTGTATVLRDGVARAAAALSRSTPPGKALDSPQPRTVMRRCCGGQGKTTVLQDVGGLDAITPASHQRLRGERWIFGHRRQPRGRRAVVAVGAGDSASGRGRRR